MRIGFFGCGNMGRAIAVGMRKNNSSSELYFYSPGQSKAQSLARELGGHHIQAACEMPHDLDWFVLAFKPQSLSEFEYSFPKSAKILSVLAGTTIERLSERFKVQTIARLMPNTPSSLGEGANLLYLRGDSKGIKELLCPLGRIFEMETEDQLDALTAFSGSGPALIFEFARLFEQSLEGISSYPQAREMIVQTFLGSSLLMKEALQKDQSFEELRRQVTSPKGVTHEALEVLGKNNFAGIMDEAFQAAHRRTLEIKKGLI